MRCDSIEHLALHLAGPLRLCRADGSDVTPKSQKAQALLALLATATGFSRPRIWVQDKLWSDSPQARGASNLRQCIHRLRKEVPIKGEWLLSDSHRLALDPQFVSVHFGLEDSARPISSEAPEFCEGLDVKDPEFEDWIRDRRFDFEDKWEERCAQEAAEPLTAPAEIMQHRPTETLGHSVLLIAPPQSSDDELKGLESMICMDIAANVSHIGGVEIRYQSDGLVQTGLDDAVCLQVRTFRFGENVSLQSVLSDPKSGAVYWSDVRHLSSLGSRSFSEDYSSAVAHVTSATAVQFADGPMTGHSTRKAYRAICDLLTFDSTKFDACEQVLASFQDEPRSASLDAWRAYLRVTQVLERTASDRHATTEEAIALSRRALERDPRNPVVIAQAAHVALYLEKSSEKAWALAKSSVLCGPCSPIAYNHFSAAAAAIGESETSRIASGRALELSASQPNRSFWYILECFAKINSHDFEQARKYALLAHQMSPTFRPSLRYLIALSHVCGDEEGASAAITKLSALEPGFSIEQFNDSDYPTPTLRRAGLTHGLLGRQV
ncbi:hypothetical protein [Amaricoccus macauensis]|uniref:hypothetical protein n=1 Tax=Amaricoccus macauensis TaxID=57001 RepID=UPI003C7AD133